MRRSAIAAGAAVLMVTPIVLAFYTGGFLNVPRFVATLIAWALVLLAALVAPRPLPRSWPGVAALAGLVLICVWTGVSIAWAPLANPATANLVRLLMYVGWLIAAAALLREIGPARAVEPVLGLGTVIVVSYGLAGRLLPGLLHYHHSSHAGNRLEQPITYANAEGALAAIGFVLVTRLAGDRSRPMLMRALGAAATAPLGLAVYLSYSRGALAAGLVGLLVLLAAAPTRAQLRAVGIGLAAAVAASLCAIVVLPRVASGHGSLGQRELQGALMILALGATAVLAGLSQARVCAAEDKGQARSGRLARAQSLPAAAAAAMVIALGGLVVGGLNEHGSSPSASASRGASHLTSVKSRRYDYWRLGVRHLRDHPLRGLGSGAFRVVWLRERPVPEGALEVHSLPLEMALELGAPGVIGLLLFLGGLAEAGRRALRRRRAVAAGACAAITVLFMHAAIDWDWQLPAVTLPGLVLAGLLIGSSEALPEGEAAANAVPAGRRRARVRS